jgi:hypothetical protein
MTVRGVIPVNLSNLVGKVYNLCRVKSYSNSRVLGHGRLEWLLSSPMSVLFFKVCFLKEKEKGAGRSTRRVQPWHNDDSEYLEGTAEKRGWSCLIDHRCSWKINEFPPSLELLLKMVL